MPTLTDDDQKSAIDQKIDAGHGAYSSAGIDQLEAFANDPSNHDKPSDVSSLGKAEASPNNGSMNYTGGGNKNLNQPKIQKALGFAKKRGGIIGLISLFGVGGGVLAGFFGPASLLINLTENFSLSNDSSSTVMERRLMKVFTNATKDSSSVCASTKKTMKCKMGKISNKGLRAMHKKGVTAIFDADSNGNGGTRYDGKRTGYPKKNPTHYEFSNGKGGTQKIPAAKLNEFLLKKENRKLARKIMGRGGAFNMRVKAWTGKHITAKLFKKFGINRNGGATAHGNKKMTVAERRAAAKASRKPMGDNSGVVERAKQKSMGKVRRAGKAGIGYLIAVASCVAIKVPSIVAAGVAAIQLAQLMPIAMDLVMSPGHKAKASGVDTENSISQDDMEALGMELTHKTKNSSGKMTSALDSKYLLAAMGVNKNKMSVSKDFAPGYGILTSDFVRTMEKVDEALEPACNFIMSPAAMYSAMAIDMAVTVASSATVVGGLIKIAASWLIGEIVKAVAEDKVVEIATSIFKEIATNDLIPKAEGEQLGDVIGHSATAIFAGAGMARHLPTMTQSDMVAFNTIQQENESFHREMDIAGLSPFDTSSRYTFLGSIMYNMRTAMIVNGNYNTNIASTFANIMSLPSILSPSRANAATGLTPEFCGYSGDFKLNADDPVNSPAVNMVGLPCTGITPNQAKMSTEQAISYLEDEGWICNPNDDDSDCPEIPDGATIDQLLPDNGGDEECEDDKDMCSKGIGYIKKDNPLYDFVMNCSNPDTGDYVFNSGSCVTVKASKASSESISCAGKGQNTTNTSEDEKTGEETTTEGGKVCDEAGFEDSDVPELQHPESMEAIAVFLIDYQILQSINGEDDAEEESQNSGNDLVGDKSPPLPKGPYPANTYWKCNPRRNHGAIDFPAPGGTPIYAVADGTVTSSGPNGGWGNYVRIKHAGGFTTGYAHMIEMPMVSVGDTVKAGQQIGKVGSTGHSTGNHLHFELYENGSEDYSARADAEVVFAWLKKYNILPQDQESVNDTGSFCG